MGGTGAVMGTPAVAEAGADPRSARFVPRIDTATQRRGGGGTRRAEAERKTARKIELRPPAGRRPPWR
jgi:hypothetical protein